MPSKSKTTAATSNEERCQSETQVPHYPANIPLSYYSPSEFPSNARHHVSSLKNASSLRKLSPSRASLSHPSVLPESRMLSERVIESTGRVARVKLTEKGAKRNASESARNHEDQLEETRQHCECIVEVEKPVIQQTIVEVPDIQFVEKVVEVPQTIIQEQIREVPRIEIQEHITYKPKVVVREKIEEVPEVEIVDVLVEKIVEIPEVREQVVVKEIPVKRYVECPVAEYVNVEVVEDVERNLPVPIQSVTTVEYKVPKIVTRYERVPVPIYAPRFVEVAVPVEQMDEEAMLASNQLLQDVATICMEQYPSLCELETIGAQAKSFHPILCLDPVRVQDAWRLAVSDALHSSEARQFKTKPFVAPGRLQSLSSCGPPTGYPNAAT